MSNRPQRELSLEEWVEGLPEGHRARKELTQLEARVASLDSLALAEKVRGDELEVIKDRVIELLDDYLVVDDKLRDLVRWEPPYET